MFKIFGVRKLLRQMIMSNSESCQICYMVSLYHTALYGWLQVDRFYNFLHYWGVLSLFLYACHLTDILWYDVRP